MKIKYSPVMWNHYAKDNCLPNVNPDTVFTFIDKDNIGIDGIVYRFDPDSIVWENLSQTTDGVILDAYRENNILYITVRRFFISECPWDTGLYHDTEE